MQLIQVARIWEAGHGASIDAGAFGLAARFISDEWANPRLLYRDDILMWICEFQTIFTCFSLEMELNVDLDVPLQYT
jgi:hypothetical protein